MANMPRLLKQFHEKQAKKDDLRKQQELRKKKLLEDAREYFGYDIDPRDPKFQAMEEKREEEARLLAKQKKKEERAAKKMARVTSWLYYRFCTFKPV